MSNINFLFCSAAERDGLIKLVRKAEFSKSEIQLLIDLLLNKQLEAPEVIDDWSEVILHSINTPSLYDSYVKEVLSFRVNLIPFRS